MPLLPVPPLQSSGSVVLLPAAGRPNTTEPPLRLSTKLAAMACGCDGGVPAEEGLMAALREAVAEAAEEREEGEQDSEEEEEEEEGGEYADCAYQA